MTQPRCNKWSYRLTTRLRTSWICDDNSKAVFLSELSYLFLSFAMLTSPFSRFSFILPVVSRLWECTQLCEVSCRLLLTPFHDAFITTVFVSSLPKMPATAQSFGQPLLILHLSFALCTFADCLSAGYSLSFLQVSR